MAFRVKNLMIHVLPEEGSPAQPAPAQTNVCWLSCQPCLSLLSLNPATTKGQGTLSPGCEPTPIPTPILNPEALSTVKAQLQDALKAVEEQEKLINEPTNITTLEEAQTLENHLTAALEAVQQRKQELQNNAAGEQGPA